MMYLHFCPPRISPKENGWSKRRIPPQTPPPPLAKSESSRGFAETISPENCFRKTESVLYSCFRPFPFGKALCFAQRRESATDARLVCIRIVLKKSSDFVQETQPKFKIRFFVKIRSVAKRRDGGFRQNSPRVFEIQKERAGREAGVRANLFKKISFGFEIFFGSDN